MKINDRKLTLNRRDMLRLTTAGALGATLPHAQADTAQKAAKPRQPGNLYADLLHTWCDGLLTHQVAASQGPALHGALLCPACALIHGRCGDAVYPLLRMAHTTGDQKYLAAAIEVYDWTERQVSRADGSWINDVTLSNWQGITVFHTIALAEALHHHGDVLDAKTRARWNDRVARAAKFIDGFMTIETGNINYPITGSYCLTLCGQMLGESKYLDHGRQLAHTALEYLTPNNLVFGEGHPLQERTPKGCFPVDLGYNVEESLPALAIYSLLTDDKAVLDRTITAMRSHMEFMLPDGGWDNSWGTRNYKWTYWGSRTSDGCQTAYALLAKYDPRFAEVARRNTELMAACTSGGLLYGGPDYASHGDQPCIHHTFTHAKALATVLDRGGANLLAERPALPRDLPYAIKSFSEIDTHLASVGDWRATVTGYDWEYVEHVQAGGASGGGHATGGSLSMLFHAKLGPLLAASMTRYQLIEISNQQGFLDYPHMETTPRIELPGGFTSTNDRAASLKASTTDGETSFVAHGRLLDAAQRSLNGLGFVYSLRYRVMAQVVEIVASSNAPGTSFILPIICRSTERFEQSATSIRVIKPKGTLTISAAADPIPAQRTFNLVPGFECLAISIPMQHGRDLVIRLEVS